MKSMSGIYSTENSQKKMVKAAITGGAGSGKTTVCNHLKKNGIKVVSSDMLARKAVEPGTKAYNQIVDYFGKQVILPNGELNRQKLRQIIISDDNARKTLEGFVHPDVVKQIEIHIHKAEQAGEPVIMIEVPLLFEANLENRFDTIVTVSIEPEIQLKRIMERDTVSFEEATALIQIQMKNEEKVKRSEFIIKNNGTRDQLIHSTDLFINSIYEKYLNTKKNP